MFLKILVLVGLLVPDLLGNISVPSVSPSGTFPLTVEYGFTTILAPMIKTQAFMGAGDLKREQRFLIGTGARQWRIDRELDETERIALRNFWESRQSAYQPFTFNVPLADGSTEVVTAAFANAPLVINFMAGEVSRLSGLDLIEVATGSGPSYSVAVTVTRFPDAVMATSLTDQVQKLIKLVRIKPRLSTYPTIYLSDQRCTIGGQLYLPRLISWEGIRQVAIGMPGVGTESDNVRLVFGNADRVMSRLVDDVQMDYATVELLAYHVNSQTLAELWAGEVIAGGWKANAGPEFTMQCSDPISSPFQVAPPRIVDRKCDKFFGGVECPFASEGALNTTEYASADPATCDHGFLTANGCAAHGMQPRYNGVIANPQSILTKDNSTGVFGLLRNTVVAASIINDSAYGHCIPIVVTDIPFPVPALIVAIRDEGDFLRALGIVGEGPLTIEIGSTLDGILNHGYPKNLGFRYIAGNDPVVPAADQMQMFPYDTPNLFSAGVAALELLISNQPGIQPTLATQHQMQALVSSGWKGWVWTAAGARIAEPQNLTNPVWLAVNLYLRCRRLHTASQAAQEAVLDFNTILPAAAICDLVVDRIVALEQGQETQWKFIGVLGEQKPLRDWMADVLLNCLGTFCFNFGKLSISVRENGAAQVAYTDGNIIHRSLQLESLGPQFTRLTATFADREHNYTANTATFQDDDYAAELGAGALAQHKDAQMNLSGTADISPAQRFAVTRGREEVGGGTAAERKAARRVSWKTTILGLDTNVGMVASITNEEMPGGFGKVRIERWSLNDDWSIDFQGRACTNSMYDLVQGPKPADVRPGDIPGNDGGSSDPITHHICWHPNTEIPPATDPVLDPDNRTFKMQQVGSPDESFVVITGEQPVNRPQYKLGPRIADVSYAEGTGNLVGGSDYYVALAVQKGNSPTLQSGVKKVTIPASASSCSIAMSGIAWPTAPDDLGWDKIIVYASQHPERLCMQEELAGGVDLPSEITFTGQSAGFPAEPIKWSTYGAANGNYGNLRLKVKQEVHPGCIPSFVSSVNGDSFSCMHMASNRELDTNRTEGGIVWNPDAALLAADNWARPGQIVSFLTKRSTGVAPIANAIVTAYDHETGTITTSPGASDLGVEPGDVFVLRFVPVWSTDGTSFTDAAMFNGIFPQGTSNIGGNKIARIIAGKGKGQTRTVTAHDNTSYTFESGFVGVDSTSIVIIEFAEWLAITNGGALNISDYLQSTTLDTSTTALLQKGLIVQGVLVDVDRIESPDDLNPTREFFPFNDISYGVGGKLQLAFEVEFGLLSTGSPGPIAADDRTTIREALAGGFLQGWSIVNEGDPDGETTIDMLKNDDPAAGVDSYTSVLGSNLIRIPAGAHDKVIFSSAFDEGLETLEVKKGDLFKFPVLSVPGTPPVGVVLKIYVGAKLAKSSDGALLAPVVDFGAAS